ncbi:MAG: pyruvate formate-lyase [Clostridiales bacterium]|nr:pyruvate formate-lyase [Clostridiales bacterium]
MTSRVQLLRKNLRTTKPSICVERARLVTEAYQRNFLNPPILQNAKAFEHILDNCTLLINDGELIVGNQAERFRGIPVFPEWGTQWIIDEIDLFETRPTDPVRIPKEERKDLLDILRRWSGTSFEDVCNAAMDHDVLDAERVGVMTVGCRNGSTCEVLPDFRKLMKVGLRGLIQEAENMIAEFSSVHRTDELQAKIDFEQAVIITLRAVIRYANRFADYAASMAEKEADPIRKAELSNITVNCRNVPENPPQTFYEGLQFVWFIHLLEHIEDNSHGNSVARFDQYLYPLYDKDIREGIITREEAVELLELLFIKFSEVIKLRNKQDSQSFAGYPMWQNLMIGGYDKDLKDITNDLTFAVLDAAEDIQLTQPSIALQLHKDTPEALMRKAVGMTQRALAMPAYYNAELITDLVLQKGATLNEAREYSIEGCTEVYSDGNSNGRPSAGYLNGLKLLELALNNGVDPISGFDTGVRSGDPAQFICVQDVVDAFNEQLAHFTEVLTRGFNIVGAFHSVRMCVAYNSSFIGDCIKKGSAAQQHGAKYSYSGVFITGTANVADSFAAIQKAVYEDQFLSLSKLNEILKKNKQA